MVQTGWYILAFTAIGLAASLGLYALVARWIGSDNLMAGGLFCWTVLGFAVTAYVDGASYLFLWPTLFISAGWLAVSIKDRSSGRFRRLLLAGFGIPGIILIIPMAHKIVWAFAAQSVMMVSVLVALLFTLLVGTLGLEHISKRWILPVSSLVLGLVLLLFAVAISGPMSEPGAQRQTTALLR
jgi:hypothetical protein